MQGPCIATASVLQYILKFLRKSGSPNSKLGKIRLMEEILHHLIGSFSHYLWAFYIPDGCRIFCINSIIPSSTSLNIIRPNQQQKYHDVLYIQKGGPWKLVYCTYGTWKGVKTQKVHVRMRGSNRSNDNFQSMDFWNPWFQYNMNTKKKISVCIL